jgi:two-component system phosphate regulon sensor histidine kinase PhoR
VKIEKVLSRPKLGLWIFLFVLALAAIATLATSYNVEIIAHLPENLPKEIPADFPVLKIVLGGIGFIGILTVFILFFARLVREIRVSQLQSDFLDRISHELRTPLSTLTLVSDLIQSDDCSADEKAKLWNAHRVELDRIKQDVEMLLQAAKLREAKLKPNLEAVWLEDWFSDEWPSFKLLLGNDGQLLREGEAIHFPIQLDPKLMTLVFRNLLDNARKFSLGRPIVHIKTKVIRSKWGIGRPKFEIEVMDEGRGFSPDEQDKLFKRFSRIQNSTEPMPNVATSNSKNLSVPGTGLGLYLAAVATKSMGLSLRGESLGEGRGARFVISGGRN